MSLLTPFYLQMGSCILEDGSGNGPYHASGLSFPAPEPDGFGGWLPAVRTFNVKVTGDTVTELNENVSALRRQGVRDNRLYWRSPGFTDVLESRIRECRIVEHELDPVKRGAELVVYLTITITTDPHWLGPWSAEETEPLSAVPGHFDVTDIPGDDDALLRVRADYDDQGTGAAIAIHPDPGPGYDYLDDYGTASDTTDANALGTYKVGEMVDATLDGNEIGTAPTFDTNDNRGAHHLFVRADNDAVTPGNVTMKAVTTTTGNAIAESVSVAEEAVAASSNNLIGYELGDIQVPAGQIPDVSSASGYNPEVAQASQLTDDGTLALTGSGGSLGILQTFPGWDGQFTAFEFTIDTAITQSLLQRDVVFGIDNGGGAYTQLVRVSSGAPTAVGTHKITLPTPVEISAGVTYVAGCVYAGVSMANPSVGVAYGNNRYASGALNTGYGADSNDDLVFKAYGRVPLAFNSSVAVQAACSESSRTVSLDYVQRLPLDYACMIYRRPTAGALAFFYDGDTDTPYIADADGTGPAILDKCEIRKPLRLKPGVTNRVILGALQSDEVIGGGTFKYSYRPRFLNATGS